MNWPFVQRADHEQALAAASLDAQERRHQLADFLGVDQDTSWAALIAAVAGLRKQAGALAAEAVVEKTRADNLTTVIAARPRPHTDWEARPIDGASAAPLSEAARLRRVQGQNTALHERLAEVTAANHACTCGGGQS